TDNTTPAMSMDDIQRHLNLGEIVLIAHLRDIADTERLATARALRARTRADAIRFAHAGELAARNTDLFATVVTCDVVTADHLDMIWSRIHRHLTTVPTCQHAELLTRLDAVVHASITDWMCTAANPVALTVLRDRIDAAILDAEPDLADDTADAEDDTATLTRRGTTLILAGGNPVTLSAIDNNLDKKADALLADARRRQENIPEDQRSELPSRSQLKAQVMLGQLGDNPQSMDIRVHLYRATLDGVHGVGAGYVAGVGWLNPATADRLEGTCEASKITEIPTDPQDYPTSEGYPFLAGHKTYLEGRDATCRFPNCDVPAALCDNDHIVNSAHTDPDSDGATHPSNGQKLCRPHHRLKTAGVWTCSTTDGGFTIEWQGPGGARYTTRATGPLAEAYDPDRPLAFDDPEEPDGPEAPPD
ncbi:HNH endonuclease signature motif containing protein, partial [Corynebacterium sp. AOP12-C2-36]|uniref:HNH endonuclease signature motif containing protein n=1 Tax=Corynebacterium sp. AOP12-C2-36 TaxID=3457723 RepID=UPI004033EE88